jgi:hypothetical protein
VNHAISAIGSVTEVIMGEAIIKRPEVKMFRQGVNVLVPTKPTYQTTWDITVLFRYVKGLGENKNLNLERLREKVVILLRIDLLSRSSDLEKLYWTEIKFDEEKVQVRLYRPKEWRSGSNNAYGDWSVWLVIYKYKKDLNLCTVTTLREWMERTKELECALDRKIRNGITRGVIISLDKREGKHYSIKASSIAKICADAMKKAGISKTFRSQSIRGAAASAALDQGAPIETILQQGRWSDVKMFRKYYYRKITRNEHRDKKNLQYALRAALDDARLR